jgi:hypothetical protein
MLLADPIAPTAMSMMPCVTAQVAKICVPPSWRVIAAYS